VLGVVTQFFLNMEIERYTLATGETALPGSIGSEALGLGAGGHGVLREPVAGVGHERGHARELHRRRAIRVHRRLRPDGHRRGLTLAPVVYVALERLIFVKVAAVGVVIALGWRS